MKARAEPAHLPQVDRQEVEEERALVIGGDAHQAAAPLGRQPLVKALEVRGLAAEPRAVIDDLEMDLARPMVDERHCRSLSQARAKFDCPARGSYSPNSASTSRPAAAAKSCGVPSRVCPRPTFSNRPRNTGSSTATARCVRKRTRPNVLRRSKTMQRIARSASKQEYTERDAASLTTPLTPCGSPSSWASSALAVKSAAIKDAKAVASKSPLRPAVVMRWPERSTRWTERACVRSSRSSSTWSIA